MTTGQSLWLCPKPPNVLSNYVGSNDTTICKPLDSISLDISWFSFISVWKCVSEVERGKKKAHDGVKETIAADRSTHHITESLAKKCVCVRVCVFHL